MKNIKKWSDINEEDNFKGTFRTVNYKDLDTWSPKLLNNEEKITGKKHFDLNIAQKVLDLFENYRLYVSVSPGDFCKRNDILLVPEKDFKEYRVYLQTKVSFDEFIDNEYGETPEDKTSDELQNEYENYSLDDLKNEVNWSVFLPKNPNNLELKAMYDSSIYLYTLSKSYSEVMTYQLDRYEALERDGDAFKKFINKKQIKITNKNIEDVTSISYRLYKDSNAFDALKDYLEQDYNQFIKEWLEIINKSFKTK